MLLSPVKEKYTLKVANQSRSQENVMGMFMQIPFSFMGNRECNFFFFFCYYDMSVECLMLIWSGCYLCYKILEKN